MDAEVVVVGAGPTGLMLAGELGAAGVRTVVLERRSVPSEVAKAGGLAGQILQLLDHRGELDEFRAVGSGPDPAPRFPFGGLHLDFSALADPPMRAVLIPQARLEYLLAERAHARGVEVRRGFEVVGLQQDDSGVTLEVRSPDGVREITAAYVVGCDGGRSRIREAAGIEFLGTTFPETQRLASFTVPDAVTVRDDGSLAVAGRGVLAFGYTTTERGVFGCNGNPDGTMGLYTAEDEATEYDDAEQMSVAEMQDSITRVVGFPVPLGEPRRLTRFTYSARHAERYRTGRVLLAGDAAHLFPAGGVAVNAGMTDAVNLGWKLAGVVRGVVPPDLLDSYQDERRPAAERTLLHTRAQVALRRGHGDAADALRTLVGELATDAQALQRLGRLMAGADQRYPAAGDDPHPLTGTFAPDLHALRGFVAGDRPLLIDLAGRADLRAATQGWADRVDVRRLDRADRPADALLVRPDAYVAWAARLDEPLETAGPGLRAELERWFGPAGSPGRRGAPTDQSSGS